MANGDVWPLLIWFITIVLGGVTIGLVSVKSYKRRPVLRDYGTGVFWGMLCGSIGAFALYFLFFVLPTMPLN